MMTSPLTRRFRGCPLPHETLATIFEYCLYDDSLHGISAGDPRRIVPVLLVCRKWRAAALECSALWALLNVRWWRASATLLERSKGTPLSVEWDESGISLTSAAGPRLEDDPTDVSQVPETFYSMQVRSSSGNALGEIIDLSDGRSGGKGNTAVEERRLAREVLIGILAHSDRIRKLRMILSPIFDANADHFTRIWERLFFCAESLQSLTLYDRRVLPGNRWTLPFSRSENLAYLELRDLRLPEGLVYLPRLEELTLSSSTWKPTWRDLLVFLTTTTRLRSLRLDLSHVHLSDFQNASADLSIVALPYLAEIALRLTKCISPFYRIPPELHFPSTCRIALCLTTLQADTRELNDFYNTFLPLSRFQVRPVDLAIGSQDFRAPYTLELESYHMRVAATSMSPDSSLSSLLIDIDLLFAPTQDEFIFNAPYGTRLGPATHLDSIHHNLWDLSALRTLAVTVDSIEINAKVWLTLLPDCRSLEEVTVRLCGAASFFEAFRLLERDWSEERHLGKLRRMKIVQVRNAHVPERRPRQTAVVSWPRALYCLSSTLNGRAAWFAPLEELMLVRPSFATKEQEIQVAALSGWVEVENTLRALYPLSSVVRLRTKSAREPYVDDSEDRVADF